MGCFAASAPGKAILFREHGVNRGQPALATSVSRRVHCRENERSDDCSPSRAAERESRSSLDELHAFRQKIDALRAMGGLMAIRNYA